MSKPPSPTGVPIFPGDIVKEFYTIQRKIGSGAFGTIYSALYQNAGVSKHCAIKFEKEMGECSLISNEVVCGMHNTYRFVSMELLGPSIIQVVNRGRPYLFSLLQMLKFGIQTIDALRSIHQAGYVHRDVKPVCY
ncbi:MAG: hypothetical protein EZS28_043538 [Streblomastix strix]|uniref:Protein kinase domain-containing protein n=1 Tax=Streblomastix strix TaxID=222440 RepID=A0A5J4TU80_9EUKA|nr:MAG: hypothetical protein EZS28_043538 [Streblomastix strix]